MLEAIAVDLDTAPPAEVVVQDVAHATIGVNLKADAKLDLDVLPDHFDLVHVDQLVHLDRVL